MMISSMENLYSSPVFRVSPTKYVAFAPGNLMAKIGAFDSYTLTPTVSEWKFGRYFEFVGDSQSGGNYQLYVRKDSGCVGKWVDLFAWQGESVPLANRAHGLVVQDIADNSQDYPNYFGSVANEQVYSDCWDGLNIVNSGGYTWRTLTCSELYYLVAQRPTSTLGGVSNARFARVTVSGVDGLLIFPDNIGSLWNSSTMGTPPSSINKTGSYVWGTDTYTYSQMLAMVNVGVMFLPAAGYNSGSSHSFSPAGDPRGHYWTNESNKVSNPFGATYLSFFYNQVIYPDRTTTYGTPTRSMRRSVRLVRDIE